MSISADALDGAGSAEEPLLVGHIHGFRSFQIIVDGDTGQDLLAALTGDVVWPRRRPMQAVCVPDGARSSEHASPDSECSCGIYAHHPFSAPRLVHATDDEDDTNNVMGVVEAWGRIEVHKGGFRAEFARPSVLIVRAYYSDAHKRRIERLATRYGAEYLELEDGDATAEHLRSLEHGLARDAVEDLLIDLLEIELHPDATGYLTKRGRAIGGNGFCLSSQDRHEPWAAELPTGIQNTWILRVAGVGHYSAALQRPECSPGEELRLLREPDNPHDPHAVSVWDPDLEEQIGYIPKDQAPEVCAELEAGRVRCVISMWEWRNLATGERFGLHILVTRARHVTVGSQHQATLLDEDIPF